MYHYYQKVANTTKNNVKRKKNIVKNQIKPVKN